MVDLPNEFKLVDILIHKPGRKLLVASSAGVASFARKNEVFGAKLDR